MKFEQLFEMDYETRHDNARHTMMDNNTSVEAVLEEFLSGFIESYLTDQKWKQHLLDLIENDLDIENVEKLLSSYFPSGLEKDYIDSKNDDFRKIPNLYDNAESIQDMIEDGQKVKLSTIKQQLDAEMKAVNMYGVDVDDYMQ